MSIQNIVVQIGEIKINVSEEIKREVKLIVASIKKDNNLTIGQKERLIHEVYQVMRNYAGDWAKSNNTQILVREFLKSKFIESFKAYTEKYKTGVLKQVVNKAIVESKKEQQEKSSQTEEKKDPFENKKNTILRRLGYVEGKRGSQDNSPDIEKWMLTNTGEGVSRTTRGFWINDILRMTNISQLNAFLRQNRLDFKNDHLLRGR